MTVNIYPVTDIDSIRDPKDGHYGYLLQAVEDGRVTGFRTAWKNCECDTQGALIRAVAEAAGRITKDGQNVLILSDNKPVIDGILNIHSWEQNDWKRSRGRRIKRAEDWQQVSKALEGNRFAAQRLSEEKMSSLMLQIKEKEA